MQSNHRRLRVLRHFVHASALLLIVGAPLTAHAADSEAKVVTQVAPSYPAEAARSGTEGWVDIEFTVGADGKVSGVSVMKAKPSRTFEAEAVKAIKKWTFTPATKDGQPVSSIMHQKITFSL